MFRQFRTVMRGAIGLGRSSLGVGLADDATIDERRRICSMCDQATRCKKTSMRGLRLLSPLSQCGICRCAIAAKTRLANERCPVDKW